MANKSFRLTIDHLKLMQAAYVDWDGAEYGAPEISCKRPYGSRSVELDICRILGWVKHDASLDELGMRRRISLVKKAKAIHMELEIALQIVLMHAGRAVKPGLWRRMDRIRQLSWQRVGD